MLLNKYGGGRFTASSAGLFSSGCSRVTGGARTVLISNGINEKIVDSFYSSAITEKAMAESDIVIGVTDMHRSALKTRFPQYADKIITFDSPVADLWESDESYRKCFQDIKNNILQMFSLTDKNVSVREMDESGASQSAVLEKECFSHPWKLSEYEKARKDNKFVCLCAYSDGEFAGFLMACSVLDEGQLLDIAVAPKFRRAGIASALVGELIARMEARGVKTLMLEAREKNIPARSLYEKYGFTAVGKRKKYYKDPTDDAVLYTLVIGQ